VDTLIVLFGLAVSILGATAAIAGILLGILLWLGVMIEVMTAGRVSFGLGDGRLWRRVRHGRNAP
jgi:hypothetical protein